MDSGAVNNATSMARLYPSSLPEQEQKAPEQLEGTESSTPTETRQAVQPAAAAETPADQPEQAESEAGRVDVYA